MKCSMLRYPHTTQERKEYLAIKAGCAEFPVKIRAARGFRLLPNAWDDYWKFRTRNWKNYRKAQWKA